MLENIKGAMLLNMQYLCYMIWLFAGSGIYITLLNVTGFDAWRAMMNDSFSVLPMIASIAYLSAFSEIDPLPVQTMKLGSLAYYCLVVMVTVQQLVFRVEKRHKVIFVSSRFIAKCRRSREPNALVYMLTLPLYLAFIGIYYFMPAGVDGLLGVQHLFYSDFILFVVMFDLIFPFAVTMIAFNSLVVFYLVTFSFFRKKCRARRLHDSRVKR